ncbi:MAG: hypothetical protein JXX28_15640 [Deltaproteobacteria bacterium]|nr:hypothetical protein [Deltaproteobacteria bacterium]
MAGLDSNEPQMVQPDAGLAFRVEMWFNNVFLGYWKHFVAAVALVLFGILIYGQYTTWYQGQQRQASQQIADTERALYKDLVKSQPEEHRAQIRRMLPNLPAYLMNIPLEDAQLPLVTQSADALAAIGQGAAGTEGVEAWLQAAELYRLAGQTEKQREALTAASARAKGPLLYGAQGGLANLEISAGEGDAAIQRLSALSTALDGYLAEQATLDLAMTQQHFGHDTDARHTYEGFLTKWPTSLRVDEVRGRLDHLSAAQ